MTRKRFIKLMMARGWSRNGAAALATYVLQYESYAELYRCVSTLPTIRAAVSDFVSRAASATAAFCDAASYTFATLAAWMNEVARCIKDSARS